MKERPILFSGPMVRALLDGTKTQTRRVCKPQPFDRSHSRHDHRMAYVSGRTSEGDEVDGLFAHTTGGGGHWQAKCPYGQPGDRLWVREAFQSHVGQMGESIVYAYRATDDDRLGPWRPSIHMPRVACRITLEITGVRVERLNACSEADAQAEGTRPMNVAGLSTNQIALLGLPLADLTSPYRNDYAHLWDSINGAGSWAANPWVWVVEFKRV